MISTHPRIRGLSEVVYEELVMSALRARNIPENSPLKGSPWTCLGPGSLVKGDLLMAGNVLVYGRVEGIIFTDGDVWVAPEGEVYGGVQARRVIVEGQCHGRIEGLEAASLRAGSLVYAEVITPTLMVDPQARYIQDYPQQATIRPDLYTYQNRSDGKA